MCNIFEVFKKICGKHAKNSRELENVHPVIVASDAAGVTNRDVANLCDEALDFTSNIEDKLLKQVGMLLELKSLVFEASFDSNCYLEDIVDEDLLTDLCDACKEMLRDTCAAKAFFSDVVMGL